MTDQKAEPELKTLYQITGNAADINTVLINRVEFRNLRARVAELEAQLESIWKLVPVEPTPEMLDAGRNAREGRFYPQDMLHGPRAMMTDKWAAMLAAAPSAPAENSLTCRKQLDLQKCATPATVELTDDRIERTWQFLHDEEGNPPDQCEFARAIITEYGSATAPQPPDQDGWQKLDKPARVGGGTFGIGTSAQHVVLAAQRAHEEHVRIGALTHEQMVEEERRRRQLWDMIHGQVDAATQMPEVEQKPVAEVIESHVRPGLDGRYTAEVAGCERLSVGAELFVHPQPRQPLTDKQIVQVLGNVREQLTGNVFLAFARAIERAHNIK